MAFCFLFDVAHCSKYLWLNLFFVQASEFGLAAMAEVVVARPAIVLIGTASRFARGAAHVWRYVLTTVGPERIYVCMEPAQHYSCWRLDVYCARSGGRKVVACGV